MSATALVMRPMEWAPLEDIDDIEPLGEHDASCLRDVYAVLKQHGKHDRFGVTLLHKHFPMNDDEVLLERTDVASRSLILRPANIESPEIERSMQTSWRLTDDEGAVTNTWCERHCVRNIHGNHEQGSHYRTG